MPQLVCDNSCGPSTSPYPPTRFNPPYDDWTRQDNAGNLAPIPSFTFRGKVFYEILAACRAAVHSVTLVANDPHVYPKTFPKALFSRRKRGFG